MNRNTRGAWPSPSHEVVRLHAVQVPQLFEEVALLTEDPIEDPVTLPTLLLARRVAHFTKVALSGDGSDEFWGDMRVSITRRLLLMNICSVPWSSDRRNSA
jgi:asparagine synthetase B (glutamine-hydrolysing)